MESTQVIDNQTVSFEDIKFMFRETGLMIDKLSRESDRKFQETDRFLDMLSKESDKGMRKINKIGKLFGGMGRNIGEQAEEYFYRRLKSHSNLFGIEFSHIKRDLKCETGKLDGQYDIVLQNGQYVFVIEVKYKLHPNDVIKFKEKALPKFKILFPEYEDKKVYVAMAGMTVVPDSKQLCEEYGFLLLTQAGKDFTILNEEDFIPLTY